MTLVPALAEIHAAHKARQARMAGILVAPPKPLSFEPKPAPPHVVAPPPAEPVSVPEPFDLSAPLKHQIIVLHHMGLTNWRVAKRLKVTKGVVSGVLYRHKAQEHKMLLGDVARILFSLGFDTWEIGGIVGEPEHVVERSLARAREAERAR